MCSYMCARPTYSGRLRERAIAHVDLDGGERHAVVLDDDDLEPVAEHSAPRHTLE